MIQRLRACRRFRPSANRGSQLVVACGLHSREVKPPGSGQRRVQGRGEALALGRSVTRSGAFLARLKEARDALGSIGSKALVLEEIEGVRVAQRETIAFE